MATREENLKKINDELEKLDDEQLEKIAGGAMVEFEEFSKKIKPPQNPENNPYSFGVRV